RKPKSHATSCSVSRSSLTFSCGGGLAARSRSSDAAPEPERPLRRIFHRISVAAPTMATLPPPAPPRMPTLLLRGRRSPPSSLDGSDSDPVSCSVPLPAVVPGPAGFSPSLLPLLSGDDGD